MMTSGKRFKELLFWPEKKCLVCGEMGRDDLCSLCAEKLHQYRRYHFCAHCGRFFSPQDIGEKAKIIKKSADDVMVCSQCKAGDLEFNRAAAPYESEFQNILKELKYSGKRSAAMILGEIITDICKDDIRYWRYDHLLPVPLWSGRMMERGFNQSYMLAEVIARETGLVLLDDAVMRIRDTGSQAKLGRDERMRNIEGAFSISDPQRVKDHRIIIIDDAYTTGSTMNEIAAVLKKGGAEKVCGLTLLAGYTY